MQASLVVPPHLHGGAISSSLYVQRDMQHCQTSIRHGSYFSPHSEPFPKHPLFDQNGVNLLGDSTNNMLPNECCGMGEEETVDSSSPGICMEDFDPNTCFDVCGQVEEDKLAESTTTFMTPSYFSSNKSRAFLSVTNESGTMKRLRVRSIREMEQKQHKVSFVWVQFTNLFELQSATSIVLFVLLLLLQVSKGYGGGQLLFIPVHELKKTVEEKVL